MILKDQVELLKKKIEELEEQIERHKRYERINVTLFHISHAANTSSKTDELFGKIYRALSLIIESNNFFIALCDPSKRTIQFSYLIDTKYRGDPPVLSMDNPASLTAEVIRRKAPILMKRSEIETFRNRPEAADIPFANAAVWLGVPLMIHSEVFGVMGVLSYRNDAQYDYEDLDIMVFVADQIAFAIRQKRTEELLRENEERLRLITDNTSSFIGVVNTEGIYEYANDAHRNLGYEPQDLIGRSIFFMIHPNDHELFRETLRKGISGELSRARLIYRSIASNGQIRDMEGTFDSIRNADGTIQKIVFVSDDVTERNAAQKAVAKQAEMLSMILEATGAGTWEWNIESGDIVFNERAAAILGYSLEEIHPLDIDRWLDWRHPEDAAYAKKLLQEHIAGKQPFLVFEIRVRHKKGHWMWVEVRGRMVERNENGKPLRMIGTLFDIDQRRQAEAERQRLEAMNFQLQKAESLGRMAGAIAHRFNNQLHVVMGNLQMAKSDVPKDSETSIIIQEAYDAAKRAADVSGMMLTYLGQRAGTKLPVDLSQLIQESVVLLQAMAPRGFSIVVDLPEQGPVVQAYRDHLQQLLTNVVVNAWEAGEDGAPYPIRISLGVVESDCIPNQKRYPVNWQPKVGPYACIGIRDSGKGIAEADLDRLFDPFFTTKSLGRGMGLSVALGIVQAHGGGIVITSEPGSGTVFTILLPITERA
ncbi:MAG: PAS domain-containing protein [Thermodesulfobacteriota bacterium]